MKSTTDELVMFTAYASTDAGTIVLEIPNWSELPKYNGILFRRLEGTGQITSGDFLDNRGTTEDIVGRIRQMIVKKLSCAVPDTHVMLIRDYRRTHGLVF